MPAARRVHVGALALCAAVTMAGPGCAGRAPVVAPVPPAGIEASPASRIRTAFDAAPAPLTTWSTLFAWADSGEVLHAIDPDRRLLPASNMKLVTLAAAAQRLGWQHRFTTTLWTNEAPVDGTVAGALYVRGAGDPTIGWPTDAALEAPRSWARALRAQGVTRIEGDLVGLADVPGSDRLGDAWSWDDLPFGYAAPYASLTFHENTVALTITPAPAVGEPARLDVAPSGSGLRVTHQVVTAPSDTPSRIVVTRALGGERLEVAGTIGLGAAPVVRHAAVPDPAAFFLDALRQALAVEGIEVRGAARVAALPASAGLEDRGVRVVHQSAPLSEMAVRFMKESQNLYGEALLHAMAPAGDASLATRREAVRESLASLGVSSVDVQVADGSGLSRRNFLSARTLVALLRAMDGSPGRDAFRDALPIAGVDGTLERRLVGTSCVGRVRAKTGTLSHVRGLSGFVTTPSGREIVFGVLANNHLQPTSEVDAVIDAALVALCH